VPIHDYTIAAQQRQLKSLVMEARLSGAARMLRDDQELTPELNQAIIVRFRELLGRLGKSETWAAKSMDIKPSTLSQVLNGNYDGDAESRIRKIDKWTEHQMARESGPGVKGFAKTSVAIQIIGAAKVAQDPNDPSIVVVHGPSGIGKSMTADYLRADIPGALLIRISTAGRTVTSILDMIAIELRLPRGKMTAWQREQAIVEILKDTGRLIIIDEIHKLCGYQVDVGLHALRDLHDKTGCPQLWLGTADVATFLERGRDGHEAIEQIYGRVAYWVDLGYAASRQDGGPGLHTVDDIRQIVAAHQMRIAPDAAKYLADIANEPKMGGIRSVIKLCQIARRKAGDKTLTLDLLRDIQSDRLGRRMASVVEAQMEQRNRKAVG